MGSRLFPVVPGSACLSHICLFDVSHCLPVSIRVTVRVTIKLPKLAHLLSNGRGFTYVLADR
jgi:hypothetical protein